MKNEIKLNKTEKTEWKFKYKGIECKVVFWTNDYMKNDSFIFFHKGIWNSYIFLREELLGKDDFKKFIVRKKKHTYPSGDIYVHDYYPLDRILEMHSGMTYYDLIPTRGRGRCIEIGNDYNHIWNDEQYYDEKIITKHLKNTVDGIFNWLEIKTDEIKNSY